MDYKGIYWRLVNMARDRAVPSGYTERHHVIPKCVGGTDSHENIVRFLPREHFLAHQLLVKMYPKSRGLSWAVFLMSKRAGMLGSKSRVYAWLKRTAADHISKERKGKQLPMTQKRIDAYARMTGRHITDEKRAKMATSKKGRVYSEEARKNMSAAAKKRPPIAPEIRARIGQSHIGNSHRKGIPNTPELKAKIRAAHLGRKQSQEEKDRRAASIRRITDDEIRHVRRWGEPPCTLTHEQIGKLTGVSKSQVGRILRGEKYADIK